MTSLTINTPVNSVNTVLSIPTSSTFTKKPKQTEMVINYTIAPKKWYRRSSLELSSIDWDLNMNELEFE